VSGVSQRLCDTLRWLCEIPSFTGEEQAIAAALEQRLAGLELAAPIRRHGCSLVVPFSRGSGGPHVALVGHTDVVRTDHDGPVRIEGDRLYGPGAADMKAGLAVMLDLIEHDAALCRGVDLTLVFYAREEGPFDDNELGPVMRDDPELSSVDVAVCLEPSDNKLALGAVGSIHATVRFEGRTAHSARPWQGDNAIHMAGELLSDLHHLPPHDAHIDGMLYRSVTSATLASGGRGRNVVPDLFELNVNHRFAPDRSLEEAQRDFEAVVAGRGEIIWRDLSPAAPPHAHDPLVEKLAAAGVAGVEPKQAWTDVARFAAAGVTGVNLGPGVGAQAHQRNEWTSLTLVDEGRKIFATWLEAIAATSDE
jgi:succinyl-diaminopimelate desuccinylase